MDFTNDEPTQPDPLVIDRLNRGYLPKSGYHDYCAYDHLNLKNLRSDFADVGHTLAWVVNNDTTILSKLDSIETQLFDIGA